RAYHLVELFAVVRQAGEDRRDQHPARDARLVDPADRLDPFAGMRRAGLSRAPHFLVGRPDREAKLHASAGSRFDETVEVAEHERALREDRERVPALPEDLDDA